MKNILTIVLFISIIMGCKNETNPTKKKENINNKELPVKVTLEEVAGKFQLKVNNEPFFIKGAGLEFGNIATVAEHGGNSFRTWRTENGQQSGKEVLDEAHKYGLKVTMGIEVARERHGFDYNNEKTVKEQLERIKKEVLELKDHPALLMWGIGNELNLRYTNPKVWDAVNEISKMIHKVDTNHLTTTMLAGISKKEVDFIKERCSDIDVLSVQMYGDHLIELPKIIRDYGWEGPYMVTEWGATGHWQVPKTSWGAPIEENSTLKAANYLNRYQKGIEADSLKCIGSYVFLWGQKQERTPTWYGVFLEDGSITESVDVMHFAWNKSWPRNRTPQIKSILLNEKTAYESIEVKAKSENTVSLEMFDFENDALNYNWEILPESTDLQDGGDFEERPKSLKISIVEKKNGKLTFHAPEKKGVYRLFVYVDDNNHQSATANIPFKVN